MSSRQIDQIDIEANLPGPHGALNIAESAAYCGVRCAAIEAAVRDGELHGRRLGRNIIILKSDLDAFLAALEIIPAHTPRSILKRREERLRQTSTASQAAAKKYVDARPKTGLRIGNE